MSLYKYDVKKEEDNTYNKDVDSVNKKMKRGKGWGGNGNSLSVHYERVLVIC
jgi:hypothetical protein